MPGAVTCHQPVRCRSGSRGFRSRGSVAAGEPVVYWSGDVPLTALANQTLMEDWYVVAPTGFEPALLP